MGTELNLRDSSLAKQDPLGLAARPPSYVGRPMTFRDFLVILFRYRMLIISSFLLTVFGVLLWIWIRPDAYEVSAKVLIKFNRDSASPLASLSDSSTRVVAANQDIETEAKLVLSYALIQKVITQLGLDKPGPPPPPPPGLFSRLKYETRRLYGGVREVADEVQYKLALKERLTPREKAILDVILGLRVEAVPNSSIIEIKLLTRFKEGASVILNTLLEAYREQRMAVDRNPEIQQFLDVQVKDYEARLHAEETALNALKMQTDIASLNEQLGLTLKQMLDAEAKLTATSSELAALRARVETLQHQISTEPPTSILEQVASRNALLNDLDEKWTSLVLERQRLLVKFQPEHALVKGLDEQIAKVAQLRAEADKRVEESTTSGENAIFVDLRRRLLESRQALQSTEARFRSERAAVAGYKERLRELEAAEPSYNKLSREIELNAAQYRLSRKNAEEAKLADAMSATGISSIAIIDPAVDPIVPTGTRKIYLAGGAMAAGLFLGLALALISATLDHSVNDPADVTAIGWPMLTAVGLDRAGTRQWPPAGTFGDDTLEFAKRLDQLAAPAGLRTIGFMPATASAGASSVVLGVAHALSSRLGKKTLIVHLGGLPSATQRRLGIAVSDTHSVELGAPDQTDKAIGISEGLSLLPITEFSRDWTPAMTSDRIASLNLGNRWEYVLLDFGPDVTGDLALACGRGADGVVMVAEGGRTRTEVLAHFQQEFWRAGVKGLGVVLNKRRFYIPRYLYRRL